MVRTMDKLPTFDETYNSKLDKRMLVHSNIYWNRYGSYCDLMMVYNGTRKPVSTDDIDLLNSKKFYELLIKKGISIDTLTAGCGIFNLFLNDDKRSRMQNFLQQMSTHNPFDEACQLFFYIVKKSIFSELSIKFAIIVFNALLVRNKILPIIFYVGFTTAVCELIQAGLTLDSLKEIIFECFEVSIKFNQKNSVMSINDMLPLLQSLEEDLRKNWGINQLSIVGSFAQGTNNEYSDLDVVVNLQDESVESDLQKYLEECLCIPVDVIKSSDQFASRPDVLKYRVEVF